MRLLSLQRSPERKNSEIWVCFSGEGSADWIEGFNGFLQLGELLKTVQQKEWIKENAFCELMIPKKEIFMSMLERGIAFHKKRVELSYSFDKGIGEINNTGKGC